MSAASSDDYVGAAVDIGSNSVHLLVARLRDGDAEALRDESELLGLGDVVDREGEIGQGAARRLLEVLSRYASVVAGLGAHTVTFIGTEPLRRARNGNDVADLVRRELGLRLHILSEREEGQLTYLGVSGGLPIAESLVVVDIGGGSSEVVYATKGDRLQVVSLSSGSGRLANGLVEHDPPTTEELDALLSAARRLVSGLPDGRPTRAFFVGGTATNLVRLAPLSREGLVLAHRALATLPAREISARFGVNLRRAGQLPAGAAIVDALLAHFRLGQAEVSEASLRDGAIIAAARLGPDWPAFLDELIDRSLGGPRRR